MSVKDFRVVALEISSFENGNDSIVVKTPQGLPVEVFDSLDSCAEWLRNLKNQDGNAS